MSFKSLQVLLTNTKTPLALAVILSPAVNNPKSSHKQFPKVDLRNYYFLHVVTFACSLCEVQANVHNRNLLETT